MLGIVKESILCRSFFRIKIGLCWKTKLINNQPYKIVELTRSTWMPFNELTTNSLIPSPVISIYFIDSTGATICLTSSKYHFNSFLSNLYKINCYNILHIIENQNKILITSELVPIKISLVPSKSISATKQQVKTVVVSTRCKVT